MHPQKKNSKGFPMFLHLKIFKTALKSDIKQWSSRQYRYCHRCRRLHRRSRSNLKKKKHQCKRQKVSFGRQMISKLLRKEALQFVRLRLHRSFVTLVVVRIAMLMLMEK
jgi:hypothetical protein